MPVDPAALTAAFTFFGNWMWNSYGKDMTEHLAKKLDQKIPPRSLKKEWNQATEAYVRKMYDETNWLRLLGKREGMPLESIYTDVNVLDELSAEQWYAPDALEDDFRQRRSFHFRQEKKRQQGLPVVQENQRLYILGKPGAGKTTFLKYVALEALKQELGEKLPIFITLKALSDEGSEIVPHIAEQFRQSGFPEAEAFARRLLEAGNAVVLFDGLDEVNLEGEKRATLIRQLQAFVREFDQCHVLITCRIAARDYSFARFKYVEMTDFTKAQQKTFVGKWFQEKMALREACWEAMKAERNKTLVELAQVPLLLSLLCITFERRGEFPPDRDEVYRVAINALLFEWDSSRLIKRDTVYEGLDVKYKERLLAWIAYKTFEQGTFLLKEARLSHLIEAYLKKVPRVQGTIDGLTVLKAIEVQHGLLVERVKGIYSFSHLTVQEYFTARYIVENEASDTLPQLMQHIEEDQWSEVFLHTAGLLFDGIHFCDLFIQTLTERVAQEETVQQMIQWATVQSLTMQPDIQPAAGRALWLFLALDRDRARARALDLDHARALALDRTLDLAYAFDRDRTHVLDRALARARARARALALALALTLALRFDLKLLAKIAYDAEKNIKLVQTWAQNASIQDWLKSDLERLPQPNENKIKFVTRIEVILLQLWGIEEFWELDLAQVELFNRYLTGTQLLVDCLEVATVNREDAEIQLLALPDSK